MTCVSKEYEGTGATAKSVFWHYFCSGFGVK